MNSLKVNVCESVEDAVGRGYSREGEYAGATTLFLKEVVVVREGTVEGNSTVDLVLEDMEGKKFVAMVTGRLLEGVVRVCGVG